MKYPKYSDANFWFGISGLILIVIGVIKHDWLFLVAGFLWNFNYVPNQGREKLKNH